MADDEYREIQCETFVSIVQISTYVYFTTLKPNKIDIDNIITRDLSTPSTWRILFTKT